MNPGANRIPYAFAKANGVVVTALDGGGAEVAVRSDAWDIHIEPFETRSVVRLRIDGTLRDLIEPARALHAAIVSRVKIMAQLDIAEKRLPQDGRIALRVAGKPVDVRVSTIPT